MPSSRRRGGINPLSSYLVKPRIPVWIVYFLLSAVIVILYSVSLGHNFLFDEESIILKNPLIRDFSRAAEIFRHGYFYTGLPEASWKDYYRPVTLLTFMFDFRFWGINPLGYNLTNMFLHVLVCGLLFNFLSLILKDVFSAFLAALLFAVHPLATEAVTYLASRGDLLGAGFVLLSLLLYLHSRRFVSLLCFGLALFSKESAILTPVYLFFLDAAVLKNPARRLWRNLAPFVGVAAAYLLFRKFGCAVPLGPPSNDWAEGFLRAASMGPPFLSYLQTLILPELFQFSLSVEFARHWNDPQVWVSAAVAAILLGAWIFTLTKRGAAFFGLSLFLTALLPYLEWIHFYPEWAEHYLYLPAMGLAVLWGCLAREVFRSGNKKFFCAFLAVTFFLAIFWSGRTWQRNTIYNDTELYFDHLAKSGARYSHFGYQNLGRIALENGEADRAIVPLRTAERIEPHASVTQNLLGLYFLQKDRLKESLSHFQQAAQAEPQNPVYGINSSTVLMRMGRYREVTALLEKIQKSAPHFASVYVNLLTAYELLDEPDKAVEWAERGLKETEGKEWDQATLYMASVRLEYRLGRDDLARSKLRELTSRHPRMFWYGDIARLLNGQISPDIFLELVRDQYPGFGKIADNYILMSFVLLNQPEKISPFLKTNGEAIEKIAEKQPLVKKELERAKAFIL